MAIRREDMTPEQRQTELRQIQELRAFCNTRNHVGLRQDNTVKIGPSEDEVIALLQSCGRKLGINFVAK